MTILKTEELVKIYKTKDEIIRALDGLDVEIPKGSTALLGPNGSGKSTLIKIILKLIKFNSGSFELFGYKSDGEHYSRNQIGYMPETPSIVTKVNAVKFIRHFLNGYN